MKIIKRGDTRWWIGRQITCDECNTIFELDGDDELKSLNHMMGTYQAIDCPTCNVEIIVPRYVRIETAETV